MAKTNKNETEKEIVKKEYKSVHIGIMGTITLIAVAIVAFAIIYTVKWNSENKSIMESFREYLSREEVSFIYFTSSECPYCDIQDPIVKQIAKDYDIDYLEVDKIKLNSKQIEEIATTLKIDSKAPTPTMAIVKNNEVVATRIGVTEGHVLVKFLIRNGVLKEGAQYTPEQNLTFIDYDIFQELREEEGPVAVIIGGLVCPYCASAKPILSNIAKAYDIEINYLTLESMSKENINNVFSELVDMGYANKKFIDEGKFSTPAILVFEDGKIIGEMEGLANVTEYAAFFKKYKVIED